MKKIMIAIVSAVFVISIVIIAFLGVQAQVHNETILVNDIILDGFKLDENNKVKPGEIVEYRNSENKLIYSLYSRHLEEDIDESSGKDYYEQNLWNAKNGDRYDYNIKIWDFNYVYESSDWLDGKTNFKIKASTIPQNATKRGLIYVLNTSNAKDYVDVTSDGVITFKKKLESALPFVITVKTEDYSDVTKKIYITANKYEEPKMA